MIHSFAKSIVLFCILTVVNYSLAQDSLQHAQTFQLESLRYSACAIFGEESRQEAFEEHHGQYFDSIAIFIKSNPQAKFEIRCYTDSRGNDSVNLLLSQNRADDWIKHLTKRGVDKKIIEGIGVGELFARKVWCKDSTYFINNPNDFGAVEVYLTDDYINSFEKGKKRHYLHLLNRRTELTVSELDYDAQRRVNHELYTKELYGDKQVVLIGAGTVENNDTLRIINVGNLHLHLVAAGTENEFTIRSKENRQEEYYYNRSISGEEKLLDLSSAKGAYELVFFGDGGSGELVLIINE